MPKDRIGDRPNAVKFAISDAFMHQRTKAAGDTLESSYLNLTALGLSPIVLSSPFIVQCAS